MVSRTFEAMTGLHYEKMRRGLPKHVSTPFNHAAFSATHRPRRRIK
jgi:hypothetical protein